MRFTAGPAAKSAGVGTSPTVKMACDVVGQVPIRRTIAPSSGLGYTFAANASANGGIRYLAPYRAEYRLQEEMLCDLAYRLGYRAGRARLSTPDPALAFPPGSVMLRHQRLN